MASKGWLTRFDDPVVLDDGTTLRTLRDAVHYLAKTVPKVERDHEKVLNAADHLTRPAPLKQMLDTMVPHDAEYIFTNSWKRPYKHAGTLGTAIRNLVQQKLGVTDYSMQGLRKNAGMELALAGCTVPEIMAVLGHQSPKMAIFYIKQANKVSLGETATAKLETYLAERGVQRVRYAEERAVRRRASIKRVK